MAISEFQKLLPINEGWSTDQKYKAYKADGSCYLMRISPMKSYQRKLNQYRFMQSAVALQLPICKPIEFGICDQGVYSLQEWILGDMLEIHLRSMDNRVAYQYGLDAGHILFKLHSIPPKSLLTTPWLQLYNKKIDRVLFNFEKCGYALTNIDTILNYITTNRHLLKVVNITQRHGDYHTGNMILYQNRLHIIDFDRSDLGDPYEDFNCIYWCVKENPTFACGMVDGYFDQHPTYQFWRILKLYIYVDLLSFIPWAISQGEQDIKTIQEKAMQIISWYPSTQDVIPTWYEEKPI